MSKIAVALDLDGTLMHATEYNSRGKLTEKVSPKLKGFVMKDDDGYPEYKISYRPYLTKFLKYLFSNFDVGVYTSASESYATPIIQKIFSREQQKKLKFYIYDNTENKTG